MADVFISYSSEDRDRLAPLAAVLEQAGYSIWWDQQLRGGAVYSDEIEKELLVAKAVIVAWSKQSVASRWVKDEAAHASTHDKLIPICLDDVNLPIGFGQFHKIDFARWDGAPDAPEVQRLLESLANVIDEGVVRRSVQLGESSTARAPGPRRTGLLASVIGLGIAAMLIYALMEFLPLDSDSVPVPRDPSVAVLPFANLSGDPEQVFFSDGISDEIIGLLAQVDGLRVTARTSAFLFRDGSVDVREIGTALGVAHVLEGSVRRAGDQLRITAQLVDTRSGSAVWGQTFDRTTGDVFAIQEDVAAAVLDAMQGLRGEGTRDRFSRPEQHPDMYVDFLLARNLMYDETPDSISAALRILRDLVVRAPEDARAHASLARALIYASDEQYGDIPFSEAAKAARPHIETALRLSSTSSEAHAANGLMLLFDGSYAESVAAFERAAALAPGDVMPWFWLHFARQEAGDVGGSKRAIIRAAELDPFHPPTFSYFVYNFASVRPDEVTDLQIRFAERWPEHAFNDVAQANVHIRRGELDEGHAHLLKYCDKVGYRYGFCGVFQVDLYYELGLLEHLAEVERRDIEPPLLDRFMCPVDSIRPLSALAAFRTGQYSEAVDLWSAEYSQGIPGRDPAVGAVYAASRSQWTDVRSLLEPYAASSRTIRTDLISMHQVHERFYVADLAMARRFTGDQWGSDVLLRELEQFREEIRELHAQRLISTRTMHLLDMSIAAVRGDGDEALESWRKAFDLGYRFRGPMTEPLLLQWRDTPRFQELQAQYDAEMDRMRANVIVQLEAHAG
ncbi:MAG: TIR domain-containing protein [Gammaproteobacteria bacterium]|nr:TIR domain-containing protein [Gammaproteobacteria bacterium]